MPSRRSTSSTGRSTGSGLADAKVEGLVQWSNDPPGGLAGGEELPGSNEYFARVEAYRYAEQPWMQETFMFDRFAGQRVLEIGIGLGTDHLQLARAGALLTGVDLTPVCVELTQRRFAQEGLHSQLSVMDAEHLELPDQHFDAVYSFGVLHHTASAERAFREVRRVLRRGGLFVGAVYSKHSYFSVRMRLERLIRAEFLRETWSERLSRVEHSTSDAKPYVRLFSRAELRRTLREAGFESVTFRKRHVGFGRRAERLPAWVGALGGWYLVFDAR